MASFFALLDDIALLAKATAASVDDLSVLAKSAAASVDDIAAGASKAASKTAPVLIDDTAVTPQYLQGISPARELPIVWRIARGSLVNKAIIIAAIMIFSALAPWIFPWALIIGGGYLSFEGAEKLLHALKKKRQPSLDETAEDVKERNPRDENAIVRSAVTTDIVLSIEIMLISMSNIESTVWWVQLGTLILLGIALTALVYGLVAALIKLDDIGVGLTHRGIEHHHALTQALGSGLIKAMPVVFNALSVIGTAAMLWVGGHLLLANAAEVGLGAPYELVHHLTSSLNNGFILWLAEAFLSAVAGIAAGVAIVALTALIERVRPSKKEA